MAKTIQQRILLGLKVRQFRQELGLSFDDLSKRAGISVSYLNEIEKGKKYPQPVNLAKLAAALELTPEFLESAEMTKHMTPVGELLQSNFLNELPLDLFGIDLQQVIEIIARAPDRVNAFISALLEIARNYSVRQENFYFAALRAYQELHLNYFEDIEQAADDFVARHQLPAEGGVAAEQLADILKQTYQYKIDAKGLTKHPELQDLRSVYNPTKHRLLLNPQMNERQRAFQLAKELGFNVLELQERPLASTLLRVKSFEEVLNNYKAAYFAVAVLINRHAFIRDLEAFFAMPRWDSQALIAMMNKYQASPEVLLQRFNLMATAFDLQKIFFLRFIHDTDSDEFEIDKELHLNRRQQPHATGLNEHYCRRWLSLTLLTDLKRRYEPGQPPPAPLIGVQRATFLNTGDEYLFVAVAKTGYPTASRNVSVALGVLLDDQTRQAIRFWNDPAIPDKIVNTTCQRCPIADCAERAAPPVVVERRAERKKMLEALKKVTG